MSDTAGRSQRAAPPRFGAGLRAVGSLHSQMVEAVLAGSGLERVAELAAQAARGPVAVVVPQLRCCALWPPATADRDALSRYVGARVRGEVAAVAADVVAEAPVTTGGELVGLVLLLAPGNAGASDALRAAAVAAVTELAVEDATRAPEGNLRAALLDDVRAGRAGGDDLVARAASLGFELGEGAVALCADLRTDRPDHLVAAVAGSGALAQRLNGSRVHALVLGAEAAQLAAGLAPHGAVGLSRRHPPDALAGAFAEAELALALGARTVELARVRALRTRLAPVQRHDADYGTGLVATLEALAAAGWDRRVASMALGVRELILGHRLERVAELTGLAGAEQLGPPLLARRVPD